MAQKETLSRQDLIYAATALRQAARAIEQRATDPGFTSLRVKLEAQVKSQDELAAKFDRIAKTMD